MTRNTTSTYSGPYARASASSRPIPPDLVGRRVTTALEHPAAGRPLDTGLAVNGVVALVGRRLR